MSQNNPTDTERNSSNIDGKEELQCNYLVVGAGTSGMSFVDTVLTENPSATVIIVDRNEEAGGHWVHVYPFCELHQASCNYGVNSVALGKNVDCYGNERFDVYDRATGQEVVEYYKRVCDKFKATGRVKCFFGVEYDKFDPERGKHIIVPKNSQAWKDGLLHVKCDKVVRMANNVIVPSMRKPLIPIHQSANFVSVNDMPSSVKSGKFHNYIVFGCGKTGADSVVNLLRNGVDQSQITWIVSRDVWYFVRETLVDFFETFGIIMKEIIECKSVQDVFLRWEEKGLTGRLDPSGPVPNIFKFPIMNKEEIEMMQSIENVVRMGRATSVKKDKIMFDQGSINFSSGDTLLVDCMVDSYYGLDFSDDFQVFEPGRINLGPHTIPFNSSYSAAHLAFLECALDDDESKNKCCFFIRGQTGRDVGNYVNLIGGLYLQAKMEDEMMNIPGGLNFMIKSRTNDVAPSHHKGGMIQLLWFLLGPQQGASFAQKLTKKVESKGFSDIDHCFGLEN